MTSSVAGEGSTSSPAAEQLNFATYLVNGVAGSWWESHVSMFDAGHVFTWAEFRTAFRAGMQIAEHS